MLRSLTPLAQPLAPPRALAPRKEVPDGLYKLLSREEAVVAAQVFDYLCGLTDFANLQMEEVCSMYDNQIAACPNLKAFLREENAPLLAYLRFAPRPLRLREFLRMLCPPADERELEAFEAWGRQADQHPRPVSTRAASRHLPALGPAASEKSETPCSAGRMPKTALPCSMSSPAASAAADPDLQSPRGRASATPTERTAAPPSVSKVRALRGLPLPRTLGAACPATAAPTGPPLTAAAEPPAAGVVQRPIAAAEPPAAAPAAIGTEPATETDVAAAEAAVERILRRPDKMQEEVKRYVQQRYVELMMVDGMDPNEACAIALREAPTVLANSVSHDSPVPILSAGLGLENSDLAGDLKYSARSVYA